MSVETDVKPVAAGVSSPDHAPAAVIRKAAVLGAGTMGSRIAAHLANAGLPVVLLDIPAPGGARSAIASQALDALKKSKPAAFYDPASAARVCVGILYDVLGWRGVCRGVMGGVRGTWGTKQPLGKRGAPH